MLAGCCNVLGRYSCHQMAPDRGLNIQLFNEQTWGSNPLRKGTELRWPPVEPVLSIFFYFFFPTVKLFFMALTTNQIFLHRDWLILKNIWIFLLFFLYLLFLSRFFFFICSTWRNIEKGFKVVVAWRYRLSNHAVVFDTHSVWCHQHFKHMKYAAMWVLGRHML